MPDFRSPHIGLAAVTCLAALFHALPATATGGEQALWAGAGLSADCLALEGRYLYDLSDFWSLGGGLEQRLAWPLDEGRSAAFAEARMVIDALTFVPALSLVGGGAYVWPTGVVVAMARLEASLAWRPARDWGLMLRAGVERQFDEGAATALIISLAWGRFSGGASDLDL